MSKAMTAASKEQLVELMQYLSQNISVPTIGIGGGFAPIGTIISYMGTTAPQDYLICDGTTYNIADYKQLSDFFAAQFGSANFFGGDGVTTFKVPDLRGEFLRGTGTNSHTDQGSGANVGEHQDGTLMPESLADDNMLAISKFTTTNFDFKVTPTTTGTRSKSSSITSDDWGRQITTRPTNTSVLYCIKAVAAGDVYSTTERVVGTWIDGKKVYEKVIALTNPTWVAPESGNKNPVSSYTSIGASIDEVINCTSMMKNKTTKASFYPFSSYMVSGNILNVSELVWDEFSCVRVVVESNTYQDNPNTIRLLANTQHYCEDYDYISIIRYTKTTD